VLNLKHSPWRKLVHRQQKLLAFELVLLLKVCRVLLESVHLVFEVPVGVVARSCKGMSTRNQLRRPGMHLLDTSRYLGSVGGYKDRRRMHR
jgi:hypothetical protein